MKIAFFAKQLGLRGTEVATYDYADYNEEILGNKSIIVVPPNADMRSYTRFTERFDVQIRRLEDVTGVDYIYILKSGEDDGLYSTKIPTLVHVVFRHNSPHGHRYAYISDWLAKNQGYDPETHSVPHIVDNPPEAGDMRHWLGIPENKTVFGRYGGFDQFDIPFVHRTIERIVQKRDDIVFLFMNTDKFYEHKNIIYLEGTWDQGEKASFINTCDAMLHARMQGETFGLSVAEFSMGNKPVLTWPGSEEAAHIDILGDHGLYYCNEDELEDMIIHLPEYIKHDDYYKLYSGFSPDNVMMKFKKIFL